MSQNSYFGEGRVARRHVLQVGGLGLLGVTLPRLLESRARCESAGLVPRADACIILFLNGGPSHLDMWDPKPNAPDGIRGEFQPISTSLPGYQMGEYLPRLARHAHRATVVRSMHHGVNNSHAAAVYASLTGHDRGEIGGGAQPSDYPSPGSLVSLFRPPTRAVLPHVTLPYMTKEGAGGPPQPGFFGGFLGHSHDPLFVLRDPNAKEFGVPELTLATDISANRLSVRRELYQRLQQNVDKKFGGNAATTMTAFQARAIDLLTSPETQRSLSARQGARGGTGSVRAEYLRPERAFGPAIDRGRNAGRDRLVGARRQRDLGHARGQLRFAQGAALASIGCRLRQPGGRSRRARAAGADHRGGLRRLRRSPKINASAGRDHWNYCYSLMMIGGGFKQGLIYGTSDRIGAFPASNALTPGDVVATLYHLLGIRHDGQVYDAFHRPYRIVPSGDVINDLMA